MRHKTFTEEHIDYIREIAEGRFITEIAQMFNEHFGTSYSVKTVMYVKKRNKICSHVQGSNSVNGRYQKGHECITKLPIGSVRFRLQKEHNNYWWIKVADPNVWIPYHKWLWENAYGKVPKGHTLYYLDGDQTNCCLRNLECIPRNILCLLNHLEPVKNAEITKVRIAELKLAKAMVDRGAKNIIKYCTNRRAGCD